MAQKEALTNLVAFRLNDAQMDRLAKIAGRTGKNPNEFCRDHVLGLVADGIGLTKNEEFMLEEIAIIRHALVNGFGRLGEGKLTREVWHQVEKDAVEKGRSIAKAKIADKIMKELQDEV